MAELNNEQPAAPARKRPIARSFMMETPKEMPQRYLPPVGKRQHPSLPKSRPGAFGASVLRGAAVSAGQAAVPDGGHVVRIHCPAAIEPAPGAVEGELHRVGRVVVLERIGVGLDGGL